MTTHRHHRSPQQRMLRYMVYATVGVLSIGIASDMGFARKELLTTEEKDQLRRAERIHLDALALAKHGAVDSGPLASTTTGRLERLGYHVVSEAGEPADVTVKIKCEEAKTWEGPGLSGGDADLVNAAARLWNGPACQISYRIGTRAADWRHEVRTDPPSTGQTDTGTSAFVALIEKLRTDDFPFLLAAEWDQAARLVTALDAQDATGRQKVTLLGLIGNMGSLESIPRLTAALNDADPAVSEAAATALGTIGHQDAIPALQSLFASGTPERRRIAAIGLGRLAPLYPSSSIIPTLLAALPREPVPTQIIIVRALGKTPDRRILEPLRALHRSVLQYAPEQMSTELKELKSTLEIAMDQFDDGMHVDQ